MSDFSDRPFVAGSLTGLRAFDVDSLGRLRGVTVPAVFEPGENVAQCHRQGASLGAQMARMTQRLTAVVYGGEMADPPEPTPPEKPQHPVSGVKCTCGYYAYYTEDASPYVRSGRVTALIEGYGVCAVGTRGFRAQKARLVALVVPEPRVGHDRWDQWADWNYSNRGGNAICAVGGWLVAVWSAIAATGLAVSGSGRWAVPLFALALVAFCVGVITARAWVHGLHRAFRDIHPELGCSDAGRDGIDYDKVLRNYPEVPTYYSLREALAAHPLTTPPKPTPADEDFWTRGATA